MSAPSIERQAWIIVTESLNLVAACGLTSPSLERLRPCMTDTSSSTSSTTGPRTELQPRQLIVTLYGLFARKEDNWLSVASMIRFMGELEIDDQAVRSSISRLKRRDVLRSKKVEGVAGYALSPSTLETLREGDARIFSRTRSQLGDPWVMVVFSVPESERGRRHDLRVQLSRLGFGTVTPGVWIAPDHLVGELRQVLSHRNLEAYVDLFSGVYLGLESIGARVREWWDLQALANGYDEFLTRYESLAQQALQQPMREADSFRNYIPMLTMWRELPYLDPGLPLELLPNRWRGELAEQIFDTLDFNLRDSTNAYAAHLISIERRE